MAETDKTNFNLIANKAVGDSLLNTDWNKVIAFLLEDYTEQGTSKLNQDLQTTDSPTFKTLKITDAIGLTGNLLLKASATTGEVTVRTAAQVKTDLGIPAIIAGKATVINGKTTVTLTTAMPGSEYVFAGIVYGTNEVSFVTADPATYTANQFIVDSDLAGQLYYTLTQIL
jgi:hypothetical protein